MKQTKTLYPELLGEIYAQYGSRTNFLKKYNAKSESGLTDASLSKKLNGQSEFKRSEMIQIKNMLKMSLEKAADIFLQ